jgi:hypothetical protein
VTSLPLFSLFLHGWWQSLCCTIDYLHCGGNSEVCIALYIATAKEFRKETLQRGNGATVYLSQPRAGSHAWRSAQLVLLLQPPTCTEPYAGRGQGAVGTIPFFVPCRHQQTSWVRSEDGMELCAVLGKLYSG